MPEFYTVSRHTVKNTKVATASGDCVDRTSRGGRMSVGQVPPQAKSGRVGKASTSGSMSPMDTAATGSASRTGSSVTSRATSSCPPTSAGTAGAKRGEGPPRRHPREQRQAVLPAARGGEEARRRVGAGRRPAAPDHALPHLPVHADARPAERGRQLHASPTRRARAARIPGRRPSRAQPAEHRLLPHLQAYQCIEEWFDESRSTDDSTWPTSSTARCSSTSR